MIQPDDIGPLPDPPDPKGIDPYLRELESVCREYDRIVSPELKVPVDPGSDEEIAGLKKRLADSGMAVAEEPQSIVRIANLAISRRSLRLARVGIDKQAPRPAPALAILCSERESETASTAFLNTVLLKVPDAGPSLIDIGMGLFWGQLNTVSFGQAEIFPGTARFYALTNSPLALLNEGHLEAAQAEIEEHAKRAACEAEVYFERELRQTRETFEKRLSKVISRNRELETRNASLRDFARDRDRLVKIVFPSALLLGIPGIVKLVEWLHLV